MPVQAAGMPGFQRHEEQSSTVLGGEDLGGVVTHLRLGAGVIGLPVVGVGMARGAPIGESRWFSRVGLSTRRRPTLRRVPDHALKRGGGEVRPDQFQEFGVREGGLGTPFAGWGQARMRTRLLGEAEKEDRGCSQVRQTSLTP